MTSRPTRQSSLKSAATRQRLLEAAVTCLWQYGYAGTTLSAVAREAGLSRGPQQYYFPSKVDLMVGVWEYISNQLDLDYRGFMDPALTDQERLDLAIDASIRRAGTKAHVVELELKLATRGDAELQTVLQGLINKRESEADAVWVQMFGHTGVPPEDLIAHRYAIVGMIHGLAIERISGRPKALLARMEEELRTVVYGLLPQLSARDVAR